MSSAEVHHNQTTIEQQRMRIPETGRINPLDFEFGDNDTAFLIENDFHPQIVYGACKILIGRGDDQIRPEDYAWLNTNMYGEPASSISRLHAVIVRCEEKTILIDMGSKNGTFINDRLLVAKEKYVLLSGDQIRFGELNMFVFFKSDKQHPVAKTARITLTDHRFDELFSEHGLAPSYVSDELFGFLSNMESVQEIINVMRGVTNTPPRIESFTIDSVNRAVHVDVFAMGETIDFIHNLFGNWKAEHSGSVIRRLRSLNHLAYVSVRERLQDDADITETLISKAGILSNDRGAVLIAYKVLVEINNVTFNQEVSVIRSALARAVVDVFARGKTEKEKTHFEDQLMPFLYAMLLTPVSIQVNDN